MVPKHTLSIICIAILTCWTSIGSAQSRLEAGTTRIGGGLGIRSSSEGTVFAFGASGGMYVLKGLDIGISTLFQSGGSGDTLFLLTGDLRLVLFPDMQVTPYIAVSGGRAFIESYSDAWILSPGGGVFYFFGPRLGIDLGLSYRWFFFPDQDPQGSTTVQMGVILLF